MTEVERENHGRRMSLGEHLDELRRRIIYALIGLAVAMAAALACGNYLVRLFKHPYVIAMRDIGRQPDLAVLAVTAGFSTYMKISLIAGMVLASPWVFYQVWMFVSAGLRPRERRYVLLAVPFSAGLFISGAMFFLLVIAVPVLKFFIFFSDWLGLKLVVTFSSHVSLMTGMMLVFGAAFQTPLVMLVLAKMGLVSLETLRNYRRHVVVAILVLCAMLTPPDPVSQLCLALPMWLLYESGVLLVYLFVARGRKPAD